jgi:hypothetical protein
MSTKRSLALGLIALLGLGLNILLYSRATELISSDPCNEAGWVCTLEAQYNCDDFCYEHGGCSWVRFLGGTCFWSNCYQDFYWKCADGAYGFYYDCLEPDVDCPVKK